MLSRIYIDNYKSLVNFDFEPGPIRLILGPNGSGKSSIFEAISRLRRLLLDGAEASTIFGRETRTRWDTRKIQVFELTVDGNGGRYVYRVEIEHLSKKDGVQVALEDLNFDGRTLYSFRHGEARLFHDSLSAGTAFPSHRNRSGLYNIPPLRDETELSWFKRWMRSLCCVRINPDVQATSDKESSVLNTNMNNFISWFRRVSQERIDLVHEWFQALHDGGIAGFNSMGMADAEGDARRLLVELRVALDGGEDAKNVRFGFKELSDGQRVLIMLYGLAFCAMKPNTTLFIDDPVLHVALAEIQPWLRTLLDRADDVNAQVLLISHHPELINYLARDKGVYLDRDRNGPVRIKPTHFGDDTSLPPAEMIARGWET